MSLINMKLLTLLTLTAIYFLGTCVPYRVHDKPLRFSPFERRYVSGFSLDSGQAFTAGRPAQPPARFGINVEHYFYRNSKTAAYIRANYDKLLRARRQKAKGGQQVEGTSLGEVVDCVLCGLVVEDIRYMIQNGHTLQDIEHFFTQVCIDARIEDKDVCSTVVQTFQAEVVGVFLQITLLPLELCGFILGMDCGVPYNPRLMWNVTFPPTPKPPVVPPSPPAPGSPTLRVLHLTDMHYDPEYMSGSKADCSEPLCCRRRDGQPAPGHAGAGKYGDYRNCDAPKSTLDSLFQHLQSIQDQFDYVMFTGDLPPHNVWNQTQQDQLLSLDVYTSYMRKYLPSKPVFNTLGNHESAPMGNYPPPYIKGNGSVQWLYEAALSSWRHWLPSDTESTILRSGFYAYSPFPGLKIIALNTNHCYNLNFWLYVNNTDPAGMLQWFISELQESEDKGQKVHVLGHIYPGCNCCLRSWSWNYNKIVNRYESTITGQFFGHTHSMIYEVFYDVINRTRPVGVAYIPGSVTPYSFLNPGYRIYEVDGNYKGSSWQILDYTNYYMNLTDANSKDDPKWQIEYKAKETYDMASLYTEDWNTLIYRMKQDTALFQKFCGHTYKSAPNTCNTCDAFCRRKLLCKLKTARSADPQICEDL